MRLLSKIPAPIGIAVLLVSALTPVSSANEVPRPSPGFAIPMNGGVPIQVAAYKGKTVVVIFLLTTCPHCQKIVGMLSKLQKEYGPRGLQVLGCAIDDMASMYVPDFVEKFQPAFPIGFSPRDPVLAFLQHPVMLRLMMPQVVFIDREQVIQKQYGGDHAVFEGAAEGKLRAIIEPMLVPRPAQKKSAAARTK